jgi:hypothetical protein
VAAIRIPVVAVAFSSRARGQDSAPTRAADAEPVATSPRASARRAARTVASSDRRTDRATATCRASRSTPCARAASSWMQRRWRVGRPRCGPDRRAALVRRGAHRPLELGGAGEGPVDVRHSHPCPLGGQQHADRWKCRLRCRQRRRQRAGGPFSEHPGAISIHAAPSHAFVGAVQRFVLARDHERSPPKRGNGRRRSRSR